MSDVKSDAEINKIVADMMRKHDAEIKHLEREDSFHLAKTGRRDIVVHMAVTVLPRVNGKTVIGEKQREFEQYCFELPAKALPIRVGKLRKAFSELMTYGYQQLMRAGAVRE